MPNPSHYLLINQAGVYTKEANFFISQGGLTAEWGKNWEPISAPSLHAARQIGISLRRARFPNCHKTMGEDGQRLEDYWPEANNR